MGVKPNKNHWAKQIARVDSKDFRTKPYISNTSFPRLAYLDRAGKLKDQCSSPSDLKRAEVALSPDYSQSLLATVEYDGTGHFIIYDADVINNELDKVAAGKGYVDLRNVSFEDSFTISGLTLNKGGILNSVQGYDLDNQDNIRVVLVKSF
ncbi:helveticin J family class III bacteriocin [Lactobacillus helveticus]|uniref:helveticin J family class III bacteriocin n=1 Tax=Lactobacillus helveticus TaxID=1587 RepID=UPI00197BE92C|nr:helveticin J family class III bacteriocin [Lactobacillus helveticus]MBN6048995.1 hypothetical protein [Lactobacillus helveticus]